MDKEYRAGNDLSALIEAEKIRADKPRYAAAMKMRKEKMALMQSLDMEKGK